MKLPNVEKGIIQPEKIKHNLLSLSHPIGKGKAKFFIWQGFSLEKWERLSSSIRDHAVRNEISGIELSEFGFRYIIEGEIVTPLGKRVWLRAIWFIETGHTIPNFVTAYPIEREIR